MKGKHDEKDQPEEKPEAKSEKCNRCQAVVKKPVKREGVDCCPFCFAPLSWKA